MTINNSEKSVVAPFASRTLSLMNGINFLSRNSRNWRINIFVFYRIILLNLTSVNLTLCGSTSRVLVFSLWSDSLPEQELAEEELAEVVAQSVVKNMDLYALIRAIAFCWINPGWISHGVIWLFSGPLASMPCTMSWSSTGSVLICLGFGSPEGGGSCLKILLSSIFTEKWEELVRGNRDLWLYLRFPLLFLHWFCSFRTTEVGSHSFYLLIVLVSV